MNVNLKYIFIVVIVLSALNPLLSAEIRGTVYDRATGQPLASANITILNSQLGTATDADGQYHLTGLNSGDYTLMISYLGYTTNRIPVTLTDDNPVRKNIFLTESIFQTQKVVVTATRHAKIMQDVPVVTEIISREEIRARGVDHVAGALEDRAGIMVHGSASGGKSVSINGIDGKHVLVLDDGLPIAGKVNNRLDLSQLDVDEIEHIEIVKGPGSALYGTEAMGGVVNIISRDMKPGLNVNADAKYGSGDQYNGHFGISGGSETLGIAVGLDYNEGGNAKNETAFDITDILNSGVNAKLRYKHTILGKLTLKSGYRQDDLDYTSSDVYGLVTDYNSATERWNSSLGWEKRYTSVDVRIQGYVSNYEKQLDNEIRNKEILQFIPFPIPARTSDVAQERLTGVKSDVHWRLTEQLRIDAGYDMAFNVYESDRTGDKRTRDQFGLYGQLQYLPLQSWTLLLGSRYDQFSDVDGFISPRVSSKYNMTPDLALRATWGRGFRVPSFTDLYVNYTLPYGGGFAVIGNPDLETEKSTGGNAGIEYLWNKKIWFSVMGFRNKFENLINQVVLGPRQYSYRNVEQAVYTGAEVQTRFYLLHNLSTTLSYNYTDIDQDLGSYTVSNIAPHTAVVRLEYRMWNDRLSFMLRDQFWGDHQVQVFDEQRGVFNETLQTRNSYHVIDTSAQFSLHPSYRIRAGVNNVTEQTDDLYGPFIGRQAFVSFHVVR